MTYISGEFTGWSLTEIRRLTVPERRFWADLAAFFQSKKGRGNG